MLIRVELRYNYRLRIVKMKKEWWEMIKYPIYVTVDTNILDAANFDFNEKSTLQILVNYVKKEKWKLY